jgi:hypothetical protein
MSSLVEFAKAIDDGDSSMVASLISRRLVDVNMPLPLTFFFEPPALLYAAQRGRAEIVDILLRANARVDATDSRMAGLLVMLLPRLATWTCLRCCWLANRICPL